MVAQPEERRLRRASNSRFLLGPPRPGRQVFHPGGELVLDLSGKDEALTCPSTEHHESLSGSIRIQAFFTISCRSRICGAPQKRFSIAPYFSFNFFNIFCANKMDLPSTCFLPFNSSAARSSHTLFLSCWIVGFYCFFLLFSSIFRLVFSLRLWEAPIFCCCSESGKIFKRFLSNTTSFQSLCIIYNLALIK